ncbi:unnamed protein product [Urochloa decumbens]|uniref:Non-specific lipid-transfer protein n=1 Tax=Urochloa decumbens TaxID=240449 RepID=A0ABC8VVU5_9POAL
MARPVTARQQQQLTVLAVVALLLAAGPVVSAVTCGQVSGYLSPCLSYAMGRGTSPPKACCSGVRSLNSAARTTPDRQAACKCLKKIISGMPALKPDIVAGIPSKCGVDIPYPIRLSTDCSKVQ